MVSDVSGDTRRDRQLLTGRQQAQQRKSPVQLDIIVVGAGLSGLASAIASALSGHHVTVYESAKELAEVRELLIPLVSLRQS